MPFVNGFIDWPYFFSLKKTKLEDSDPVVPVLPDVNNLEHEVENDAAVEPHLPTSIEQDLPTTIEHATIAAEGSTKVVLDNADETGGTIELQSELEQETSARETAVDGVSSSKDAAHEVETEVEADTHGTETSKNDLAKELPETEQPVLHTTEVFIFNFF